MRCAKGLGKKIAVIGTVVPSQAKPLIMDGTIREGCLWNPTDAGYAMVAIAKLVLDGTPIVNGVEIPGLGKAAVDVDDKQIRVEKIMIVNKDTVDGLIKQGLGYARASIDSLLLKADQGPSLSSSGSP